MDRAARSAQPTIPALRGPIPRGVAFALLLTAAPLPAHASPLANPLPATVIAEQPSREPSAAPSSPAFPALGPEAAMPASAPLAPAARAADTESLPLGVPAPARSVAPAPAASGSIVDHWLVRTGLALGAVLALIVGLRWGMVRVARRGGLAGQFGPAGRAPSGVLEVLGRYPVSRGHTLVLLRMDRRVLLLGQSGEGFRALAEVDDPEEVASLLIKTRDEEGDSMSQRFRGLLQRFEREGALLEGESSLVADAAPEPAPRERWPEPAREGDAVASIRRRLAALREGARA